MRPDLKGYIKDNKISDGQHKEGPFLTISREFGCSGYELAEQVNEILKDRCGQEWKIYQKELLKQLATESGIDLETIEKQRLEKPSIVKEFLNNIKQTNIPDSFEIRNRIAFMVRKAAFDGNVIIIGQGGAAATGDMPNGLNVRIEAPREWRVLRICNREKLTRKEAEAKLELIEKAREHLHLAYKAMCDRRPAFHLCFDNSKFTTYQIAEQIFNAMKLCKMIDLK